jgi:hypothetical protein
VFASLDSIIARPWKREGPASSISSHYIGTAKDVISANAEGCPWCGRSAANIIGWREHESFGDAASIRRQRYWELANSKELVSGRMTWRVLMTSQNGELETVLMFASGSCIIKYCFNTTAHDEEGVLFPQ